ncbi:MAG: serine/threonine-protein kinase [Planctomycetota bacterium]
MTTNSSASVMRENESLTDADLELACEIEKDGRRRESLGARIALSDYLRWIPEPTHYPLALDAAIDMVLRTAQVRGNRIEEVKKSLTTKYPEFESQITRASALSGLLLSTASLSSAAYPEPLDTPSEFGPLLSDGEPRYHLKELLGGGSSGWVYKAVDRQMSSRFNTALVALKIYHDNIAGIARPTTSFEEATRARLIDHPNAVRAYDREILSTGESYAVFSFAEGIPMNEWIENEKPSIRERVRVIRDIASALTEVHRVGIIHGDIKPANILVNAEGRAWLTDFGHAFDAACPPQDRVGKLGGNLAFASPEQVSDPENFGTVSDIFSLSSLLIWAVTNELPMGIRASEVLETIHRKASRPALESMKRLADADLREITRRGVAWNPTARCQTADELTQDLTNWLEYRPIDWLKPSLGRKLKLVDRRRPISVKVAMLGVSTIALLTGFNLFLQDATSDAVHAQEVLNKQLQGQQPTLEKLIDQTGTEPRSLPTETSPNLQP